ncbi:Mitochondrial import inner membrane translocase subunit TIM44-1 [Hibiscus syriacus]|uniref:Mitochondrial import inner membrane translocase subunit TIM44-1 n=1 Tax=Hibiscus syriacus TaxID=106335 RepID=A0A6A2XC58_HIBSY|nr:mitochondrial import inner membrane translocase subunit TIM44-2-like isoform X1 [Hibiscus syriacus]KAE8664865.1 Mitochondrial import inner membrane translocase subunit TIM44-1 [Hibiscus syriacus]
MASKKLVRDFFIARYPLTQRLSSQRGSNVRLRLLFGNGYSGNRQFSVFKEFSKKIKGEASRNSEFQQSVEQLKGKAEELKVRTKQTTEKLYKQVDGAWTEAEATAKKVSANMKEKISATKEEVKESFGIGKEESSQSTDTSAQRCANLNDEGQATSKEENYQQSGSGDTAETVFGKFKSSISSPKVSLAFQRLKEAKVVDLAKKGYDIVKDELSDNPSKRKHLEYTAPPSSTGERSTRTDIVVFPSKQSRWSKKWEALKEKMQGHPLFKRVSGMSEPVVTKGQEIAEDVRVIWETSDNPVVHKIQDINESIFQETDAAASYKEIRRRDPSFSLPEFVAEVQEAIRPVLNAYIKGDVETLKKYCSPEVIDRCKAEHTAYQSHGIFFDNKILHISDVEVRETKMMGTSPIIIVAFQTQQIHCVRDREGKITEGGKDTIHTVYYAWAMQQVDVEELGEGALYPIWKLREMQQMGVQALI